MHGGMLIPVVYCLIFHSFQPISIQGSNHPVHKAGYDSEQHFWTSKIILNNFNLFRNYKCSVCPPLHHSHVLHTQPRWGHLPKRIYCQQPSLLWWSRNKVVFSRVGTCKFPDISGGNGPSPHRPIQQLPDLLNGIEIRALRWPWQNTDIPV